MSNSSLVKYTKLSPNRNTPRNHSIDTITIHCYVGQASVEDMGAWFAQSSAQASANYGIGSDGRVGLFVPESDRSWCSSSRDNDNRAITIECASEKTSPYAVNATVYSSLIALCVDICRRNGIKQLKWSTNQAERMNHLNGCNMTVHRDYANKACPGDYLYSRMGQIADAVNAFLNPSKASGIPTSKQDFINKVSSIAVSLYEETRILPSVVIAQCCLENGYGLGSDALELTKRNNLLGMKAELINSSWSQYTVWDGKSFQKVTPEYRNGKLVYVTDYFRIYKDYENCIRDYEMFLLHVRNDYGYKYRSIQGITNPKAVITAISNGGYATDPAYITKVLNIIKENNLTQYDKGVQPVPVTDQWYRVAKEYTGGKYIGQTGAYGVKANAIAAAKTEGLCAFGPDGAQIYPEKVVAHDHYAVQRRLSEEKYRLGLFSVLDNAKRLANENWGYRVYDMDIRKIVYKPKLNRVQKFLAACVRLNQWLVDDIKAGKDWRYYNSGHVSESTFWLTRKAKKYFTNCMGGVAFAMKESGLPTSCCSWYGAAGSIRWLNDHAEADLRKYADIIKIGGKKTPRQLVDDGTLCPGDILTFQTFNHTCAYLGNGLSYDSGHAYCKEKSGEGAHYVKWIGPLSWSTYKVAYIIRLKG